jgi:predicted RNA-binding protein
MSKQDENALKDEGIICRDLEEFYKEQEGSTYRIQSNNKKINIKCTLF